MSFDLPVDERAESLVLSCVLETPKKLAAIENRLRPELFFGVKHKTIAQAVLAAYRETGNHSLDDVRVCLSRLSTAAFIGEDDLVEIWKHNQVAPQAVLEAKVALLEELAARRALISLAQAAVARAAQIGEPFEDVCGELMSGASTVAQLTTRTDVVSSYDAARDYYLAIKEGKDAPRIMTPWSTVGAIIPGFAGGTLNVIAARPGAGKTAFALALASESAKRRKGSLFVTMEMRPRDLIGRMAAEESDGMSPRIAAFPKHLEAVANRPVVFAMKPGATPEDVKVLASSARVNLERQGVKMDAVFVDYLQLMKTHNAEKLGMHNAYGHITRSLKALALELDVPVFLLSQLNRKAAEGNDAPGLHHLRDSGSIESDADNVIILSRAFPDPNKQAVRVDVVKHRTGRLDAEFLRFVGAAFRFSEYDIEELAKLKAELAEAKRKPAGSDPPRGRSYRPQISTAPSFSTGGYYHE